MNFFFSFLFRLILFSVQAFYQTSKIWLFFFRLSNKTESFFLCTSNNGIWMSLASICISPIVTFFNSYLSFFNFHQDINIIIIVSNSKATAVLSPLLVYHLLLVKISIRLETYREVWSSFRSHSFPSLLWFSQDILFGEHIQPLLLL